MCNCLTEVTNRLKEMNLAPRDTSITLAIGENVCEWFPVLPLVTLGTNKKPRTGANVMMFKYCPFCGDAYDKATKSDKVTPS